jgi:glutathione S-transferase
MILVGQFDSPYTRRIAISLHVLGIAFERNPISVFADADAMRRINPLGRIPSLVLDDGEVLIDSAAILDHLDETVGPARALIPGRGAERRAALRTIALACGVLDKAGAIVYERALRPPALRFEPWVARCRTQVDSGLAALERTPWPATAQAEITTACVISYLRDRLVEAFPAGAYPELARLADRMEATPAFAQTRPADDELMPTAPG